VRLTSQEQESWMRSGSLSELMRFSSVLHAPLAVRVLCINLFHCMKQHTVGNHVFPMIKSVIAYAPDIFRKAKCAFQAPAPGLHGTSAVSSLEPGSPADNETEPSMIPSTWRAELSEVADYHIRSSLSPQKIVRVSGYPQKALDREICTRTLSEPPEQPFHSFALKM